ncbi:MAG: hypothetical protein AAGI11_13195 [Pseudomonadota bacterium]
MDSLERMARWCVFLPCSERETWAVPQNALGEIVTIADASPEPPTVVLWRDHEVPVLDLGREGGAPWRENHGGTGRVAVFLGLEGQDRPYWALALRGQGLSMDALTDDHLEAVGEEEVEMHALGAFKLRGQRYQIPDLVEIPGLLLRRQEEAARA